MRFFAIAALIVVGLLIAITSLPHAPRPVPSAEVTFSSSTASPGPGQNEDHPVTVTPVPVRGEAPWALSSLPECFTQLSRRDGLPAFVRRGLPAAAKLVPAGTRLRFADCSLEAGPETIAVTRGDDRLVVPPSARLYRTPDRLVLDRSSGGREEIRIYAFKSRPRE